jgi:hypothetical protein
VTILHCIPETDLDEAVRKIYFNTVIQLRLHDTHGPSDRTPGIIVVPVLPISQLPLTLTAPSIAFLHARGYGRSRISRKQLHNVRMDTSRLENPVRDEVRKTGHVLKLYVGE